MIFRLPPTPTANYHAKSGFSLVEVTLAIGLLAFCLIPLLGLIPTGLNAQHSAAERNLAADVLAMVSVAVNNSQFVSRDATTGVSTYSLPLYFSDSNTLPPTPKTYTVGSDASTLAYSILDDGSIRKYGDPTPARQTLFVKFFPPAYSSKDVTSAPAVRVYALVAWPAQPADSRDMKIDKMKDRQGSIESYITYVPRN